MTIAPDETLKMAAILDFFFSETLKVINNFRNEFSIKKHVEMRYYINIYIISSGITTST